MVTMLPARPADGWWVAGVRDMVDSSCVDTQRQFLERGLPVESLRRHREGVGEIWVPEEVIPCMLCGQPRDKSHIRAPPAPRLQAMASCLQTGSHL